MHAGILPEMHDWLLIGALNGMKLRVIPVLNSDIQKISDNSILPLKHLRVFEVDREKLTLEDLQSHGVALTELEEFLKNDSVREMVVKKYVPFLAKYLGNPFEYGWCVSFHLKCTPGHILVDIVVGDVKMIQKIKDELTLLTT